MREREIEMERASERERKRASEREEVTSGNAWVTPPSVSPVPHAHVYNPGAHNWCRAYVWVTPPSASPVPHAHIYNLGAHAWCRTHHLKPSTARTRKPKVS